MMAVGGTTCYIAVDSFNEQELCVYRRSDGTWYFWFTATDTQESLHWGTAGDMLVATLNSLSQ